MMMEYAESSAIRDILKAVPIFRDLTTAELDQIIALGRMVTYPKDMILFKEGDQGEALYVVLEGSICVSKAAPSGKESPMAFMERGSCFGEMALVDDFPRGCP